jgi:hypothetical protein
MSDSRKDDFGIGVIKYAKEHEAYIESRLDDSVDLVELARYHSMKIRWLQHERLVHLMVTILFAVVFMFLFGLLMLFPENWLILVPLAIVMILLCAYILHYFKLENTVQRWYKLYDEIDRKIK